MKTMRQRQYLFALLMLLAVFAACKGESPTAPTSTSGGGGVTPPVSSVVTLTVSQATALVSSTSVVTATVTKSGQPVPNGTAVEFTTDFGTFVETGTQAALRTTTNGVATVTITSSTAGKSTIQAVVNNVSKTTSVTFNIQQPPTCPPDCPVQVPSITAINPAFGSPGGGETVTITGVNLFAPVRVFFDFGAGTTPKEAFIVSRTDTQIVVVTPAVDLGTGQTKSATIVVVTPAGTATETRVPAPTPFVFQAEVLTPTVSTVSPDTGPIDGGTRITIFGSGFQAPVQVSFAPGATAGAQGWTAIQVVSVSFNQIIAVTPAARDVNPTGSGVLVGPVDLRVRNILSDKEVVKAVSFRYTAKMQITAAGPSQGPVTGGTKVVIDGIGFNDPVAVSIGGFAAQPIKVTGTQVTAVTAAVIPTSCSDFGAPITVTNIDNGDFAAGPTFTYKVPKPSIVSISPLTVSQGNNVTIVVANALGGTNRFTLGDKVAFVSSAVLNPATNMTSFTVTVPSTYTFATAACTAGTLTGTAAQPLVIGVTYLNVESGCTDTVANALTINPPSSICNIPPTLSAVPPPGPLALPTATVAPSPTHSTQHNVQISNAANPGSGSSVATGIVTAVITGPNASDFIVNPTSANIVAGGNQNFVITFTPSATGARTATLTFSTNDPAHPTFTYQLSGNGT
jgi:hypothetical protein